MSDSKTGKTAPVAAQEADPAISSKWPTWSTMFRWLVTLIILGVMIWWLSVVLGRIGAETSLNKDTKLVLDPYANAKEILAIIMPLVTLVLGYWFGIKGADDAKATAATATASLEVANQRATIAALAADPARLNDVMSAYPGAFGRVTPTDGSKK